MKVELDPKSRQGDLIAALTPVVDRLLKHYKAAQHEYRATQAKDDDDAASMAKQQMDALILFKGDIGAFLRLYAFLSQIFNYGNTDIEKRTIIYRRLLPLLEFGRERDSIDLSKVKLNHHVIKTDGPLPLSLSGERNKLAPSTEAVSGQVQMKEKVRLAEILEKLNDLFTGELTDDDKLVYVNNVILGKLLESAQLSVQAANNSKAQFSASPDLSKALENAIMDALTAHTAMSKQALDSEKVREGLKDILLGPAQLYDALRARAGQPPASP